MNSLISVCLIINRVSRFLARTTVDHGDCFALPLPTRWPYRSYLLMVVNNGKYAVHSCRLFCFIYCYSSHIPFPISLDRSHRAVAFRFFSPSCSIPSTPNRWFRWRSNNQPVFGWVGIGMTADKAGSSCRTEVSFACVFACVCLLH
jgi:hypothetical protein